MFKTCFWLLIYLKNNENSVVLCFDVCVEWIKKDECFQQCIQCNWNIYKWLTMTNFKYDINKRSKLLWLKPVSSPLNCSPLTSFHASVNISQLLLCWLAAKGHDVLACDLTLYNLFIAQLGLDLIFRICLDTLHSFARWPHVFEFSICLFSALVRLIFQCSL